ncbi:hypothetical protein [Nocardia fusca]|uniref:hypothetical protein n=1 Tax=Nocardia fusca TaxID=941183 RepID=UPI000A98B538|nr:hypothetical protein [Nocardia fusca]
MRGVEAGNARVEITWNSAKTMIMRIAVAYSGYGDDSGIIVNGTESVQRRAESGFAPLTWHSEKTSPGDEQLGGGSPPAGRARKEGPARTGAPVLGAVPGRQHRPGTTFQYELAEPVARPERLFPHDIRDAFDPALRADDDGSRDHPLLSERCQPVLDYRVDIAALTAAPTRIVIGCGEESAGTVTDRTSTAIADRLGQKAVLFPSHHGGFTGPESGYPGQPEAFARTLRGVLDRIS